MIDIITFILYLTVSIVMAFEKLGRYIIIFSLITHNNIHHICRRFFAASSCNYRVTSLTSPMERKHAFGTRRNIFMAVSPETGGFSESFVDGIAGSEPAGQQSSLWGARA